MPELVSGDKNKIDELQHFAIANLVLLHNEASRWNKKICIYTFAFPRIWAAWLAQDNFISKHKRLELVTHIFRYNKVFSMRTRWKNRNYLRGHFPCTMAMDLPPTEVSCIDYQRAFGWQFNVMLNPMKKRVKSNMSYHNSIILGNVFMNETRPTMRPVEYFFLRDGFSWR